MNIESLEQFYAAINRHDMAAITRHFDPQILRIEPEGHATAGTYRGIAEVQAQVARGRATWAEGTCEPEEFLVNGDKVVVYLHARVRLKDSAGWSGGRFADGFQFRDGRIVQYLSFWQRADALAWAGLDDYEISTDLQRLDVGAIHAYLTRSYWSPGIPREVVERAIGNSLCFGVYRRGEQVGFARVVTDKATFAYLADVFILEDHRGKGLSKRLVHAIMEHRDLQGLRRFMLATRDAHGLYAQFGFTALANPSRLMEIVDADVYQRPR